MILCVNSAEDPELEMVFEIISSKTSIQGPMFTQTCFFYHCAVSIYWKNVLLYPCSLLHYKALWMSFFFSDMVILMDSITVTAMYIVTVIQGALTVIHTMQTWRVSLYCRILSSLQNTWCCSGHLFQTFQMHCVYMGYC